MASISQFKNALIGGGARANQFRVELAFPSTVATGSIAGANAQFLCKAATIPSSTIEDIQSLYRGRQVHLAGDRTYAPWAVTIYNDTSFNIRIAFEDWMNKINNHSKLGGETVAATYQVDMQVHQLDKNDAILKSYKFVDAYPIELGDIQLDFDANNQIETFTVNFMYNFWTSDTTS